MTVESDASPHREYDRYMARQQRWGAWWRRGGQLLFYAFAVVVTLIAVALFVVSVIDLWPPRLWGNFTQTDCEPRVRGGCRPVGTWVSDDGSIIKRGVYLDGWAFDTSTRASYQPNAIISDEVNNIVHIPLLTGAGPWIIGVLLVCWVAFVLVRVASWGDIRMPLVPRFLMIPPRRRRSASDLSSPRRRYRASLAAERKRGGTST